MRLCARARPCANRSGRSWGRRCGCRSSRTVSATSRPSWTRAARCARACRVGGCGRCNCMYELRATLCALLLCLGASGRRRLAGATEVYWSGEHKALWLYGARDTWRAAPHTPVRGRGGRMPIASCAPLRPQRGCPRWRLRGDSGEGGRARYGGARPRGTRLGQRVARRACQ